jgi:hypothetical protein
MDFTKELDHELFTEFLNLKSEDDEIDLQATPNTSMLKHLSRTEDEDTYGNNEQTPSFVPHHSVMELMDELREFEKQFTPASSGKGMVTPFKSTFESEGAAHVLEGLSTRKRLWADVPDDVTNESMVGIEGAKTVETDNRTVRNVRFHEDTDQQQHNKHVIIPTFSTTGMLPSQEEVVIVEPPSASITTPAPPTPPRAPTTAPSADNILLTPGKDELEEAVPKFESGLAELDQTIVEKEVVPLVSEYASSGGAAWEEAVKAAARTQERTVREVAKAQQQQAEPAEPAQALSPQQQQALQESKAAAAKIEDERIHGDFSHWHTGPRLTVDGIRLSYVGTYETAQNMGTHYAVRVLECVTRPDVALADLIGAIVRVAKTVREDLFHYFGIESYLRFVVINAEYFEVFADTKESRYSHAIFNRSGARWRWGSSSVGHWDGGNRVGCRGRTGLCFQGAQAAGFAGPISQEIESIHQYGADAPTIEVSKDFTNHEICEASPEFFKLVSELFVPIRYRGCLSQWRIRYAFQSSTI